MNRLIELFKFELMSAVYFLCITEEYVVQFKNIIRTCLIYKCKTRVHAESVPGTSERSPNWSMAYLFGTFLDQEN